MTPWSTKVLKEYNKGTYFQETIYVSFSLGKIACLESRLCICILKCIHVIFGLSIKCLSIYQLKISEIILPLNLVSKYLPPMIYPTILNPLNVIALIEFTENDGGNQMAWMTLFKSLTGATNRLSRDKMVTSS